MKLTPPLADEDDDELSTFWLITYSDMITLMLAFFLLMFSFTLMGSEGSTELVRSLNVVAEPRVVRKAQVTETLEQTAGKIAEQLKSPTEQSFVESSEHEVTVVLPSGVTFRSGEASLTPAAEEQLRRVAGILAGVPNPIRIEGHTDDVPMRGGAYPTNWHLSTARAQSVVKLLLANRIDPRRLQTVGYAELRPRQPNTSEEGRRANRRIELKLVRAPGGGK